MNILTFARTHHVRRLAKTLTAVKLQGSWLSTGQQAKVSVNDDRVLIDVDSKTGIATLAMNNAPVNGLDTEMLRSCTSAIRFVENDSDIRGAMVKSSFDGKAFSAGFNFSDLYQKDEAHLRDFWTSVQDWFMAWYGCSKPTVALINGHALAGGCVLAVCCDYRLMQSDGGATIGMIETMLGVRAPFFVVEAMRNTVGHRNGELALFRGKRFKAEEAKDIGLVDEIGPLDNIASLATAELERLAAIPPNAYAVTKMFFRRDVIGRLKEHKEEDANDFVSYISNPKVQEEMAKYLQRLKAKKR